MPASAGRCRPPVQKSEYPRFGRYRTCADDAVLAQRRVDNGPTSATLGRYPAGVGNSTRAAAINTRAGQRAASNLPTSGPRYGGVPAINYPISILQLGPCSRRLQAVSATPAIAASSAAATTTPPPLTSSSPVAKEYRHYVPIFGRTATRLLPRCSSAVVYHWRASWYIHFSYVFKKKLKANFCPNYVTKCYIISSLNILYNSLLAGNLTLLSLFF